MAETAPVRNIYISSDALWDLRQGTMTRINPEFAALVTSQPGYYTRDQDVFALPKQEPLDKEIYEHVFAKYANEIVRCSLKTTILEFVIGLCCEYLKPTIASPTIEKFGIEVNLYPFSFDEQEQALLLDILKKALGGQFSIRLVTLSNKDLDLEHVKRSYMAMIMYDYVSWVNLHTEQIRKAPLMTTGLYCPRLFLGDTSKITPAIKSDLAKRGKDEFDIVSGLMQPFIGIQFLPVSFFCADTPVNTPSLRRLIKKM